MRLAARLIGGLLLALAASLALAESGVANWHGSWEGLNLYVTVVARGHSITPAERAGEPWWKWGNTTTDAYLFGFGRPGVDLVVSFSTEKGTPAATLYVLPKNQRDEVRTGPGRFILPNSVFPRVVVRPKVGGWWTGSLPNFGLVGKMAVQAGNECYPPGKHLGWEFHMGALRPGVLGWMTAIRIWDPHPNKACPRFEATILADPHLAAKLAPPLIPGWPFLSARANLDYAGPERPVFFQIATRSLHVFGPGFKDAGIYWVNSYSYPPRISFEAPMAWYKFDRRPGKIANLIVRLEHFPSGYKLASLPYLSRSDVRLSWTGADAGASAPNWRYSISVIGDVPVTRRVKVGDTSVDAVPYRQLPAWVVDRPWDGASFVEATHGFAGSEGIYSYSVAANFPLFYWINGMSDRPIDTLRFPYLGGRPTTDPNQLPSGFRGEYNLAYLRRPELYFSPVDNQVHLLYPEGGLWNLGGGRVLREDNLTDGPYIDAWKLEEIPPAKPGQPFQALPGRVSQALYALDGYLIYSGPGGAEIRKASYALSAFHLDPPTGRASWRNFLDALAPYRGQARSPTDLRAWLAAFPGGSLAITGGKIFDVRLTVSGLRLAVEIPQGAQPSGTLVKSLLGGRPLKSGSYVLTLNRRSGVWSAEPATPPRLSVSLKPAHLQAFTPSRLRLVLVDRGTLDYRGPLALEIDGKTVHQWSQVTVPGSSRLVLSTDWSPTRAGQLAANLRLDHSTLKIAPLQVTSNPGPGDLRVFGLSINGGLFHLVILAALVLLASAGLLTFGRSVLGRK